MGYKRKKTSTVLNKKSTKEKEFVEQEVHIKEISEQENDEQPQYLLPEEKTEILIGDNKGINPVSDSPVIYGELKTESIDETPDEDEDIISEEIEAPAPRTLGSMSKVELRLYQRTGIMPK